MGTLEKDENTASIGDDYDYTKQYRQASTPDRERIMSEDLTKSSSQNSAMMSKFGRMGDSFFADDSSFEEYMGSHSCRPPPHSQSLRLRLYRLQVFLPRNV